MLVTPGVLAFIIGFIVWLATASIVWALVAAVIVFLCVGGGFYSRRL